MPPGYTTGLYPRRNATAAVRMRPTAPHHSLGWHVPMHEMFSGESCSMAPGSRDAHGRPVCTLPSAFGPRLRVPPKRPAPVPLVRIGVPPHAATVVVHRPGRWHCPHRDQSWDDLGGRPVRRIDAVADPAHVCRAVLRRHLGRIEQQQGLTHAAGGGVSAPAPRKEVHGKLFLSSFPSPAGKDRARPLPSPARPAHSLDLGSSAGPEPPAERNVEGFPSAVKRGVSAGRASRVGASPAACATF